MAVFYIVTLVTEMRVIWPMDGEDIREAAIDALRGLTEPGTTRAVEIAGPYDSRAPRAKTVTLDITLPD